MPTEKTMIMFYLYATDDNSWILIDPINLSTETQRFLTNPHNFQPHQEDTESSTSSTASSFAIPESLAAEENLIISGEIPPSHQAQKNPVTTSITTYFQLSNEAPAFYNDIITQLRSPSILNTVKDYDEKEMIQAHLNKSIVIIQVKFSKITTENEWTNFKEETEQLLRRYKIHIQDASLELSTRIEKKKTTWTRRIDEIIATSQYKENPSAMSTLKEEIASLLEMIRIFTPKNSCALALEQKKISAQIIALHNNYDEIARTLFPPHVHPSGST